MSAVIKSDNFDGTYSAAAMFVRLWCEATVAIASGDWVAVYATDTSNPGAVDGETYRVADNDNAGAGCDVVGVATEALASGTGWVTVQVRGRRASVNVDSGASVANGDPLCIGATAGRAVEQIIDASTTANRRTIGICRSTPSGNTATVDILAHPKFAA